MRQLYLEFEISSFAVAHFLLRPLLVGQVEYKSDALSLAVAERRRPDQHRHPAAILAQVFFLEGFGASGGLQFGLRQFVALEPVRRRQIGPSDTPRNKIFPAVIHDTQKS